MDVLLAVAKSSSDGSSVNTLNVIYLVISTIVAASVIVTSLRKTIRRAMQEVVDDRMRPHIDSNKDDFRKVRSSIDRIEGRLQERHIP